MKKKCMVAARAAIGVFVSVIVLAAQPAYALGDGSSYVNCSGRYTLAQKNWGSARMTVYGCSNGYAYAYLTSGSSAQKGVGLLRYNPWYYSYSNQYLYSVTTGLVRYSGGCFDAWGTSRDSGNNGRYEIYWCH